MQFSVNSFEVGVYCNGMFQTDKVEKLVHDPKGGGEKTLTIYVDR